MNISGNDLIFVFSSVCAEMIQILHNFNSTDSISEVHRSLKYQLGW